MPGSLDLLAVFDALPGAYLLLTPALVIEAVSDSYLAATLTTRQHLLGQYLFDAFPDNPATPEARSVANLHASLQQVLQTGQAHQMALQHYDVPDPTTPGAFVERYWEPVNTPVLDAQRGVTGIIHHVVNVTERVRAAAQLQASRAREQQVQAEVEAQRWHLQQVLRHLPAQIATYRGSEYVYDFVNTRYTQPLPTRQYLGRPIREVLPEVAEQGILAVFDYVYQTGESVHLPEQELWLDLHGTGEPQQLYLDFFLYPLRDAEGHLYGLLDFTYDITAQVRARQQVQQLNDELEARVLARTRELSQAQAETEAQRQRLAQLVAEAPALIASLRGPAHVVELANEGFRAIFGHRELVGKPYREAIPEFESQPFFDRLDAVYRTGQTYYGIDEPVILDRTNSGQLERTYITYTYQATRDARGQIDGILVFCYEVTEQVLARQEREAQRRQLHELFMQAPAPICILDGPELVYQLVNPAYQLIFPGRALVGKPLLEALPELGDSPIPAIIRQVYHTGETYTAQEMRLLLARHEGEPLRELYCTFTYQARRSTASNVDGVLVLAHDITEQVLARRQVEATAERLRLITNALPVLIGYLDRERRYQFANEAYRTWFHQDPAALLGRYVREVVGEQAYAATSGYMDRALAGERLDFEAQMPYRENFTKYIRTSYVPDERNGEVHGFYTLVTDITEQTLDRQRVERLNQELAATNAQLTRTNVDLDTFVYTASHDLKAPITNIEGILLALRAQLPAEVQQEEMVAQLLDMLQGTVARFQLTINQLTDITKLQLAHTGPAEPVLLAPVVEDVRLDLVPLLEAAATALTVEVAPDLVVSFSPANLRSIVYNLLSNAIKYRSPDRPSQVRVAATQTSQAVVLTVQDNGLGMSEVQQRQLFGLFQRLHTHVEGTGVGLYIVKRLVENGGGTITVQSQSDAGTIFTVTFLHAGA